MFELQKSIAFVNSENCLRLAHGIAARKFTTPPGWTKLRLGIKARINSTVNVPGEFAFGLCNSEDGLPFQAAESGHYIALKSTLATRYDTTAMWLFNQRIDASVVVDGSETVTTGTTQSGSYPSIGQQSGFLFYYIDFEKNDPETTWNIKLTGATHDDASAWSLGPHYKKGLYIDAAKYTMPNDALLDKLICNNIPVNEAANGIMDTAFIYCSPGGVNGIEIANFDIVRL